MASHDRTLLVLSVGCAVACVLAGCLHLLASQAAYSPLALPLPAAPFAQLELETLKLGALALGLHAFGAEGPRWALRLLASASVLKLLLFAFAAGNGMLAVQAVDPRVLAPRLFYVRTLANGGLLIAAASLLIPVLRRARAPGA